MVVTQINGLKSFKKYWWHILDAVENLRERGIAMHIASENGLRENTAEIGICQSLN